MEKEYSLHSNEKELKSFRKGYDTGKAVSEQNSIEKYMSSNSEYNIERICKHLQPYADFEAIERSAKLNNELVIDHFISLVANKLDEYGLLSSSPDPFWNENPS